MTIPLKTILVLFIFLIMLMIMIIKKQIILVFKKIFGSNNNRQIELVDNNRQIELVIHQ